MQLAGFVILVVVNSYLGDKKSARSVFIRNAMAAGCAGKEQMKQSTLFDRPLARDTDPITSHEAADKMVKSGKLQKREIQVLEHIRQYYRKYRTDFTAKELGRFVYKDPFFYEILDYYTIQRRLSGLRTKGKIERTGEKRDGCCIWRLK